ncbi:MAG: aminotransferase class I/II-fold pyridoxal phosphate-dependent enzyme [Ignavibacteria bacterium]|nr:aminotransferase class I/II-fold pyridoxal phosphate-dependent enzyme [Ignavibacteria bacterium]MCU7503360.1 aminotransferase class I/II-fold pyridoxal phosphate-dependent enzyme [Ignavibacteria bacterium]MCU7515694.1 aminotransferase class I/II-fold pyridoxal phosphate-dependent enzyme [Ignavibacteria bacterium]
MKEDFLSNYLGPKAENIGVLKDLLGVVLDYQANWRKSFYKGDVSLYGGKPPEAGEKLKKELADFLERSSKSLPYFHPRYMAQMVKDPSIPTVLGYVAFMLSNPNNHAYEGGPVTTEMEMEVVETMLKMTGLKTGWGHLSSGGSLANMEALWAARDFYKEGYVYFSEVSHYSWKRICQILAIKNYKEIPADRNFRIDTEILESELKKNRAMFVMANLGSTGTGSVDEIEKLLDLKKKYNFHLHVDAAYGGFVRSVILDDNFGLIPFGKEEMEISEYTYRQLSLLGEADSITVDPHKHGLISYGAGAVLYKNEEMRSVLLNSAPYTYHKQDKPNIGMFSLEGSRPGAMAAACYLTYRVMPPVSSGMGELIRNSLAACRKFYELVEDSARLKNLNSPDLDISCFYVNTKESDIGAINKETLGIYKRLSVEAESPEFIISKFVIPPVLSGVVLPGYSNRNDENLSALRAVFMKHWPAMDDFYYIKELVRQLEK